MIKISRWKSKERFSHSTKSELFRLITHPIRQKVRLFQHTFSRDKQTNKQIKKFSHPESMKNKKRVAISFPLCFKLCRELDFYKLLSSAAASSFDKELWKNFNDLRVWRKLSVFFRGYEGNFDTEFFIDNFVATVWNSSLGIGLMRKECRQFRLQQKTVNMVYWRTIIY